MNIIKHLEEKVGSLGGQLVTTGGHVAIQSALNRTYGFGRAPTSSDSDDPGSLAAADAMLALPSLDYTTKPINADARLSESGREEKLQPARVAAIKAIATAAATVAAQGQALKAREEEFYAVPQLAPTDAVGAIQDGRVWDHLMAQPPGKRMPTIAGMGERQLAAVRRSLIPLEPAEDAMSRDMYRAVVEKREPAKAAKLKAARADQDYAHEAVAASVRYAPRSTMLSPSAIADAAGTGAHYFDGTAADHAA